MGEVSTANFDFVALGVDQERVNELLRRGWEGHGREYRDAEPDLMAAAIDDGDVNYVEICLGDVLRDGEVLTDARSSGHDSRPEKSIFGSRDHG